MMNDNLRKTYSTIDSVMQEMLVMEEQALEGICFLLESESLKSRSGIIDAVISVLKQWNKIPAVEIKAKVDEIAKTLDKTRQSL